MGQAGGKKSKVSSSAAGFAVGVFGDDAVVVGDVRMEAFEMGFDGVVVAGR